MKLRKVLLVVVIILAFASVANAQKLVGSVTVGKGLGSSTEIDVESCIDPQNPFVSITYTHVTEKGLSFKEADPSNCSIAVRAYRLIPRDAKGNPKVNKSTNMDVIGAKRKSWISKYMRVARFWDNKHQQLVYVIYVRKGFISGSPKHSMSVVPCGQID